jgi:hypothetical protein
VKKLIVLLMVCSLGASNSLLQASTEEQINKAKTDAAALTTALLGVAGQLMTDLPAIIEAIGQFPDAVKDDVKSLQKGMVAAAALTGAAKQKKVEELFVYGVNLTILLANIVNKFMVIIAKIGPVAEAIDAKNGAKVDDALQLAAQILQMISKINIAMKNSIIAGGTVSVSATATATPKLDAIPDL